MEGEGLMVSVFGRRKSDNVVDNRRDKSSGLGGWTMAAGGGAAAVGAGALGWGLGGVEALLCAIALGPCPVPEERRVQLDEFASIILADTEEVWTEEFAERGETYTPATLVLLDSQQASLCGAILAGQGPAYCKHDETIYLDLSYLSERVPETGAVGDFPAAFIIAHEVAHHVQNLTGEFDRKFIGRLDDPAVDVNRLSVRLELQADCYAGVWAKRADEKFQLLEPGDIQEAVATAQIFGDDAVQERGGQGAIVEAAFTHGSGAQRAAWFQRGFASGERDDCDSWSPEFDAL
ncbi:MAG: neutral zinc metallopeptidase [Pseudomonadota bacterium]